ncbi:hypothetical protein DL96DRAFT_1622743 [Flagelloscypha sp. PMI_526]|nr:hypothetical protein DL96DRAFT_1622743 [Flagelloscypha sp. PMI_526]
MSTTSNTSFKNGLPRLPASLAALCPYPLDQAELLWEATVRKQGLEAATHLFEGWDLGSNQVAFGADYPQATQDPLTKVPFEHGGITLYYHPTYPKHIPTDDDFTWTFYIGKEGFQSLSHDIIQANQLASHGITVKMEVPWGPAEEISFGDGLETVITRELGHSRWVAIDFFVVSPSTVIRVEYVVEGVEHCEEFVFPSDPDTSSSRKVRVL